MFFDINDFLLGFTIENIITTIICSLVVVVIYRRFGGISIGTLYDLLLIGGIFFITQAIERLARDEPRWERTVANLLLWFIFLGSMLIFRGILDKKRPKL